MSHHYQPVKGMPEGVIEGPIVGPAYATGGYVTGPFPSIPRGCNYPNATDPINTSPAWDDEMWCAHGGHVNPAPGCQWCPEVPDAR